MIAALADRALGLEPGRVRFTRREVRTPMPDGISLVGDLYRPAEATGPLPVVLVRLPYSRQAFGAIMAQPMARQGFQVLMQSTRGSFGSGGQFRPFRHERPDGLATLDWLREQPWCDGRIATTGASYFGHTQWMVAGQADVVAMGLHITASRMTDTFYPGGAPTLLNGLNWSASIGNQESDLPLLPHPLRTRRVQRALRRMPLQAADLDVAGAPVGFWRDFTGHGDPDDEFWEATYGERDRDVPPVSMVTGWWDLFVHAQLKDFQTLRESGVDARIVVGPWLHGAPAELREIVRTDVAFLDHHLRGGPAPEGARVRLHLQQADQWLEFDEWPPPATPHTLDLGALAGTEASTFTYDPADPTPAVGGPLLTKPAEQADQGPVEVRPDVLLFTGPALETDLDVVGPVTARLFVRPSVEYADVYVRVCDVDEKGVSRNVVDGIRRLDPRSVPAKDVTVGPDGVYAVDLELFPTAYRFRAGHRIRVQVAGGAFPRFARNTGTGEPFGSATSGVRCRTEVLHSASHPSTVTLPVLA
ncbi:CocE/NonD family hydrolase [Pseudonocardia sp. WMMC193]|uniref:CocE/NonD family hydrolase n=1 Tax=Pseudonocardia sp. WMMC193 TaxID=2911965 RepID=UPI001F01B490|nr:CocE/NonD family hydrolase [Pseudonocardia sp. WMMC193]MCF7550482.1 CocE/NonD family hydrolase [Pseudonocardia sp. WMMC193]